MEQWQERRSHERASWSNTQWLNEIAELKKDGFPESDGEILRLLEAYSHITTAEEDVLNIMCLLSSNNSRRGLYAPFWIEKQGNSVIHRTTGSDYPCEMYDVQALENSIKFWADERYYYLKLYFDCGCDTHDRDYDYSRACEELSIHLIDESGLVILYDSESIIAVDRSSCSWNSILLFDFYVTTRCWQSYGESCESALMTMAFAPCYLQKNFARDYV